MAKTAKQLRAQAEKARALLRTVTDPVTIRELTAFANECDEAAEQREAMDQANGPPRVK